MGSFLTLLSPSITLYSNDGKGTFLGQQPDERGDHVMNDAKTGKEVPTSGHFLIYLFILTVVGTLLLPTLTLIGVTSPILRFIIYGAYLVIMIAIARQHLKD